MRIHKKYFDKFFLKLILIIFCNLHIFASIACAEQQGADDIAWLPLSMGLFGGLALFLAGLDMLADGLKKVAGDTLKTLLSKLTTNRFMGAITGAMVTGVLNSSSVTTVLVVGFISAGVMSLTQAVGVIMGANIGSTVTAQLLAFNISYYSLLGVAIGFFINFSAKSDRMKYYGTMFMGLGLLFYGMSLMSGAMHPLRDFEPFMSVLKRMEYPLMGIIAGTVFTGLIQSSAATVGIAITLASEGLLTLPAGIALALGANIGTCVTALIAAIGKPVDAVRAAVVHVMFNVLGVLLWVGFIPQLSDLTVAFSDIINNMLGFTSVASSVPRQIANANTLFNVINMIVFIGFSPLFALITIKLIPARVESKSAPIEAKYLDSEVLVTPGLALELVRLEIGRVGGIAEKMFYTFAPAVLDRNLDKLTEISRYNDKIEILEKKLFQYLGDMRKQSMTKEESVIHQDLMAAVVNIEYLAEIIKTDMIVLGEEMIDGNYIPSEKTNILFNDLFKMVGDAIVLSVKAIRDDDGQAANEVILMKIQVNKLTDKVLKRKSKHLGRTDQDYLTIARMEIALVDKLQRIYTLAKRMAKQSGYKIDV